MAEDRSRQKTEQQAFVRQKAQHLAAQGCPRCRGSTVQITVPSAYTPCYEASCFDCGELWWTE